MTVVVHLRARGSRPVREIIAERVRVTRDGQYLLVDEPDGTERPIRPEVKDGRHRVWLGLRFTENTSWLGGWA